jgi:hypothetical protein
MRSSNTFEWDLMPLGAKTWYWWERFCAVTLMAPGLVMLIYAGLKYLGVNFPDAVWWFLGGVGVTLVFSRVMHFHRKEVSESRERMRDPEYLAGLRRFGFKV